MEINGLPLHPLVVHAVVMLGPLTAAVAVSYAAIARWRWLLRWPLVVLAVLTAVVVLVAVEAGEDLLQTNPALGQLVQSHQEWGELLRIWSLAFVPVAALAAWALGGPSALVSGWGTQESRGVVGWVALVLLVAGSIGLVVLVYLAGESGARAVWGG